MSPKKLTLTTLRGKTLVIAGVNTSDGGKMKRSDAVKLAQDAGAKVTGAISGKTDVLVCGDGAERKAAEAKGKGIAVIDSATFLNLCGVSEAEATKVSSRSEKTARSTDNEVQDGDERPERVARQEPRQQADGGDVVEIDLADAKAVISKKLKGKLAAHVRVTNKSELTATPKEFLTVLNSIQSVDLAQLAGVKEIGDHFLNHCKELESIDLSPLSSVERLGNYFLTGCGKLKVIDLTPFRGLKAVGDFFLLGCRGLVELDLTPLSNVETIEDNFLGCCQELQSLDLTPLGKVVSIGRQFLGGCTSLKTIDLGPLSSVRTIGDYCLGFCMGLESINVTPLEGVEVGVGFLDGCSLARDVVLPASRRN